MGKKRRDYGLDVKIEREKIVISIGVGVLGHVIKFGPTFQRFNEKTEEFEAPVVTNADAFAKEVLLQLLAEEEDGTTLVHKMFDKACEEALEQGGEGIDYPGDKPLSNPPQVER